MQKLSLELGKSSFTIYKNYSISQLDECNIKFNPNLNPNPNLNLNPNPSLFIDNIEPFFYVHKESLDG